MKVLLVAGARPKLMKVAPVLDELDKSGDEALLVHTGQHYDAAMSDSFFRDLGMRAPDSTSVWDPDPTPQTARVMEALTRPAREAVGLSQLRPSGAP